MEICSDNKTLVNLIIGKRKKSFGVDISEKIEDDTRAMIKWVPRYMNKVARYLAKQGLSSNFAFWDNDFPLEM